MRQHPAATPLHETLENTDTPPDGDKELKLRSTRPKLFPVAVVCNTWEYQANTTAKTTKMSLGERDRAVSNIALVAFHKICLMLGDSCEVDP